ncbi:MAG: LysM peptidoglycan-binding domain-containing protein [Clostridiales bacterium]|nr:LysM peptidoglycan-binding domain-containing protein [Clostridiales bacterium]
MLILEKQNWYKVKEGQTVAEIAKAFCVSVRLLVKENGLSAEPSVGRLLRIPKTCGNAYTAGEGDTKALLCGSERAYAEKNGTNILYPGMRVIL